MTESPAAATLDRRTVISGVGAVAIAGVLAGCGGDGGDGDTPTGTPTPTPTPTPTNGTDGNGGDTDTTTSGGDDGAVTADEASEYASASSNYDGVADRTGSATVDVTVGAAGNDGNFAFDPPAIRIDPGTTVVWRWTGEGGEHNVVANFGTFDSGPPVSESGTSFEHPFDVSGAWTYYCRLHRALGMKGAVIVD